MSNYKLLININNNFHKLFITCKDGNTFIPPLFNSSSSIDGLIVLNQIIDIILQTRNEVNSIRLSILKNTLHQIIDVKCKEFIDKFIWNSNLNTFTESF